MDEPEYGHCDGGGDIFRDDHCFGQGEDSPWLCGQLSARCTRDGRDADFDLHEPVFRDLRRKRLVRRIASVRSGPVRPGQRRYVVFELQWHQPLLTFALKDSLNSRERALLVERREHLVNGGGRDSKHAGEGLAQFEDEEERAPHRESAKAECDNRCRIDAR